MLSQLDRVSTSSILTKADVAHLVGLPKESVQRWSSRSSTGKPSLITQGRRGYGANPPTTPLLGLSEASLLKHMSTATTKGPNKIASAIREAKEQDPRIFAHAGFFTDGTDTFQAYLGGLERVKDQQRAFQEVLAPYLRKMNFADGLLQSFIVMEMPSDRVLIDPRYRAGRPFLESSGMPVFPVLAELNGGTKLEEIADEFDVPLAVVRDVRKHRRHLAHVA